MQPKARIPYLSCMAIMSNWWDLDDRIARVKIYKKKSSQLNACNKAAIMIVCSSANQLEFCVEETGIADAPQARLSPAWLHTFHGNPQHFACGRKTSQLPKPGCWYNYCNGLFSSKDSVFHATQTLSAQKGLIVPCITHPPLLVHYPTICQPHVLPRGYHQFFFYETGFA